MNKYRCGICKREYLSVSGLKRHANAMHQGRITLSQENAPGYHRQLRDDESSTIQMPEHDANL